MRAWPSHIVFAAILVGSLAARDRTADLLVESGNLQAAIIRVARERGLPFRGYTTIQDTDIRGLKFAAPGCTHPLLVVLLPTNFDQEWLARSAREPDYLLRYVYIERNWDKASPMAVVVERAKYAALAVFGLTRYVPSWHLLLVESPPDCQAVNDIDFRLAWSRDYLAEPADIEADDRVHSSQ
jgi:hypothetical protein